MKWSDVDLESRTISVSRSWSSKNGTTSTKNQKSRIVPISEELWSFLKELKLERGTEDFVLPHLTEWTRGESLARVMAIVGHADMEMTNVYLRKAGIELKDGTERLGYKIPIIKMQKS